MKLRSLAQLMTYTRKLADALGESALQRHPDVDVAGAVNRGLAAFRRHLNQAGGVDRSLSSLSVQATGSSLYSLPLNFASLWSVELGPNNYGGMDWLDVHDAIDAADTRSDVASPVRYRIVGNNLEFQPAPAVGKTILLWYVATGSDLSVSTDMAESLEEYVAKFAAAELAISDRAWDLADRLAAQMAAMVPQIKVMARQRNLAAPARVRDTWGQRVSPRNRRYH